VSTLSDLMNPEYLTHLAIMVALYLLLAQSLNLALGLGQLFNLAHVASYAIGAYATALLATHQTASFWACSSLSILLSALFGLLLGAIARRLSSDYLAIGTMACAAIVSALLVNGRSVTNGVLGIAGIPRPTLFGSAVDGSVEFLLLIGVTAVICQTIYSLIFKSAFGRSLRALAESEHAAASLGIDRQRVRIVTFVVSSATAGLAGSFFAYYLNFIDPSSFTLTEMIFLVTIVILGRPASLWGVAGATAFLVLLPEPIRLIPIASSYVGPLRQLLYAGILFLVVWWRRDTLFPQQRRI